MGVESGEMTTEEGENEAGRGPMGVESEKMKTEVGENDAMFRPS